MSSSTGSAAVSRRISHDLLLTITQTDVNDSDLRRLINSAVADATESRGYKELEWLVDTLATATGVTPTAFLASLNGLAIGVAVLLESPERVLICALHVQSHARGIGVGSTIVHAVRAHAAERHMSSFALPGDRATKNLYEQLGMPAKVIMASS